MTEKQKVNLLNRLNDYKDYLRLMNDFRPTNLDVTQDYFNKIYESIMYNSNNSGNTKQ